MFENIQNNFGAIFGKIAPGMCRVTMNGNIAVKCSKGYKTYNVKKGTLTNVTNFCFNMGDEMFFVLPTNKVQIGDIILVDGKPKCVIDVNKKVISVIDYENSEIRQVLPERHIFMGNVYFYGKIVSMFGNMFGKSGGAKNMLKMMMMSQIMGGNNGASNGASNGGFMQNIGQMAAMSMFMGGNNPFDGMFDFDFGESNISFNEDEDDDDDDANVDNEDEVPVKKTKKARKE
ncbi:MAG: hypothetical protein IKO56_00560 [Alphaproteobacteria bacterium]|nr:hypothetical protein [Alphaproteobacteria bacterium]